MTKNYRDKELQMIECINEKNVTTKNTYDKKLPTTKTTNDKKLMTQVARNHYKSLLT